MSKCARTRTRRQPGAHLFRHAQQPRHRRQLPRGRRHHRHVSCGGRIPGQTYEGMIDFEEITSLVDGGTFNPPLTSSGP